MSWDAVGCNGVPCDGVGNESAIECIRFHVGLSAKKMSRIVGIGICPRSSGSSMNHSTDTWRRRVGFPVAIVSKYLEGN